MWGSDGPFRRSQLECSRLFVFCDSKAMELFECRARGRAGAGGRVSSEPGPSPAAEGLSPFRQRLVPDDPIHSALAPPGPRAFLRRTIVRRGFLGLLGKGRCAGLG